jgi:hypothetical protein
MYYMERYNSVGKAMAFTKLKDGMEDGFYIQPYTTGMKQQAHNQLYRMSRYEMKSAMTANIVVHQDLWNETPENAIKRLVNDEVLSGEQSHFVACMTNRVTA